MKLKHIFLFVLLISNLSAIARYEVDHDENFYYISANKIRKLAKDGQFLWSARIGSKDDTISPFFYPIDIALDNEGNIAVLSASYDDTKSWLDLHDKFGKYIKSINLTSLLGLEHETFKFQYHPNNSNAIDVLTRLRENYPIDFAGSLQRIDINSKIVLNYIDLKDCATNGYYDCGYIENFVTDSYGSWLFNRECKAKHKNFFIRFASNGSKLFSKLNILLDEPHNYSTFGTSANGEIFVKNLINNNYTVFKCNYDGDFCTKIIDLAKIKAYRVHKEMYKNDKLYFFLHSPLSLAIIVKIYDQDGAFIREVTLKR